ncbi:MAG: transcription elongation factor GreA [Lachnospiraceae bacterium]|nr:transcription elongation factor GreA [Candidatus Equihabitans merdae]
MYDRLTRSDIAKIEAEIEERKLVKRPALIEAVKEARAHGDLSENFEYHAAKAEKNQNESRIAYLEDMIKTATIIDDDDADDGKVAMNKSVEVYFPEGDETEEYKIVTTIRGNSLKGLISIDSPLGKALLGHVEGDTVHIVINENVGYDVVIKKVGPAQDDSDDEIKAF